jgi:glycosyltransferase involved in cell wall biosynthesis
MNGLIGNSALIGEQLSQLFPRLPVRVISFLTADATSEPVRPACLPGQKLRVAFLGRLVSHKRPDKLVECWGSMLAKGALSPAELQIHGGNFGNEMASALEERILALGLQKVVQLHGEYTHSELPSILAGTDIVVLPSLYEGLPLVLVEAMKHGIPVVATAAGGTSELRNDNPDVIITPGTDWSEFEQGLQQMAARVRSGKVDSTRLRRWASDRYGYSGLAQEWCDALMKPESWDLPRERVKFERDG